MIKSENRLKDKRSVNKVLARGFKITKPDFTVRALKGVDVPLKLTVVVSKKVSPEAVVRNRIKRRIREAFVPYLNLKKGFSLVVFPRMNSLETSFEILEKEAQQCVEELRYS